MKSANAIVFAIRGGWDVFDSSRSVVDHIENLLEADRAESDAPIIEWHGDHYFDPDQELRDKLARAKSLMNEAQLLCQEVLESV
ncbi:MAG: hypothetical protein P4L50_15370 [Anaerolineaceae bacterium]|nr:hypothetical protein [Anaerolineaceae bacterium]